MSEAAGRIFRFGMVGLLGIVIDFSITWLCKEYFKINKFVSNALGFSVAVTSNYILNRMWTFQDKDPHIVRQFILFLVISIIGLLMNTAVLYFLHEKKKMNFYFSKVIAIGVVFCWNYTANALFTFKHV